MGASHASGINRATFDELYQEECRLDQPLDAAQAKRLVSKLCKLARVQGSKKEAAAACTGKSAAEVALLLPQYFEQAQLSKSLSSAALMHALAIQNAHLDAMSRDLDPLYSMEDIAKDLESLHAITMLAPSSQPRVRRPVPPTVCEVCGVAVQDTDSINGRWCSVKCANTSSHSNQ